MLVRLHKLMADRGVASRRASEKLILEGKVKVNGTKITQLGVKIDTLVDKVTVRGAVINNPAKKKENRLSKDEKTSKGKKNLVPKKSQAKNEELKKVHKKSLSDKKENEEGPQKVPNLDVSPDVMGSVESEENEIKIYAMLNKPVGFVTTMSDSLGRKTVAEFIAQMEKEVNAELRSKGKKIQGKVRLFPVGRLDVDTSGLLLVTNDGEWANKIVHPRYQVVKTYVAVVAGGEWSANETNRFTSGLQLGPKAKKLTAPAELRILERRSDGTRKIEIKIAEGQNRQIRRMCLAVNHPVLKLERVAIGRVKLGSLSRGKYKFLSEKEAKFA